MEKKEAITSNPKGVCEKLFNALSVTPSFWSLRRISYHSQDPVPPHAAPNLSPAPFPPSSLNRDAKTFAESVKDAKLIGIPGKSKVAEVVPTKVDPLPPPSRTIEKEKPVKPPVSIQENIQNAKVSQKIDLAPTPASDHLGKPKHKVDTGTAVKAIVQQGKVVAGKVDLLLEGRREKEKVEAPEVAPTKGEGGRKGAVANINEKANDYITRAKTKIRTTTSVAAAGRDGGGSI